MRRKPEFHAEQTAVCSRGNFLKLVCFYRQFAERKAQFIESSFSPLSYSLFLHVDKKVKSSDMKFQLRQWHVYMVLWLWVLLYPVVDRALDSTSNFQWSEVGSMWMSFIPFIVLFLIHNRFIIPRFPLPQRTVSYLLVTCGLLAFFTLFQYTGFKRHDFREDVPPPARMEFHDRMKPPVHPEGPHREDDIHQPAPPEKGKTPSYMMDCVIAMLMLGCNLTIVLLFRMQKEQEKMQQLEKTELQLELKYLKAQLKPHFLMNMLNNIHSLIEVDPEKAQEMVINFSKLLRYTLYEGGKQLVPLSQEAAFISNYVQLMQQRCSSKKVSISLSLPECISDKILVPPLLFIVFIENAFKHGISYRQPSFIHVVLSVMEDDRICFGCLNSIPPSKEENHPAEGGIGLENVRKRLDLLFGKNYTLDIHSGKEIYSVTLNIPIYDEKHSMSGSGR